MTADTELLAHGSITACPKCGASEHGVSALTVTYHAEPQLTSRYEKVRWPCRFRRSVGEHLCRQCERCGYGWCEAVVSGSEAGDER